MQLTNKQDLLNLKNGKQRLMGLDVGDKTIGIALSDPLWIIATAHKLIQRRNNVQDLMDIKKIGDDYNVSAFIVGLPLNMNGTEGPQAQKVKDFMNKLLSIVDLPFYFWDERLSTIAVTRTLLEADVSRKRRAQVEDKLAATFILQGVLDSFVFFNN